MPPSTVDGILLPGWMEREEAVGWFRDHCWFESALTEADAEKLWATYRDKVEALPERNIQPPQQHPIPQAHQGLVNQFLARFRGPEVLSVINVDPLDLIAYQRYVVADRCDHHKQQAGAWAKKFLVIDRPIAQLPGRVENGVIKFGLPHAEHAIAMQQDGSFRIQQFDGYVAAVQLGGRVILKAGYHRSFAFARTVINEPDARDRCALVALTRSLPPELAPNFPHQGLRTKVLSSRAPLLRDFLDSDLAIAVKLRKKCWEAHFQIVPVNVD